MCRWLTGVFQGVCHSGRLRMLLRATRSSDGMVCLCCCHILARADARPCAAAPAALRSHTQLLPPGRARVRDQDCQGLCKGVHEEHTGGHPPRAAGRGPAPALVCSRTRSRRRGWWWCLGSGSSGSGVSVSGSSGSSGTRSRAGSGGGACVIIQQAQRLPVRLAGQAGGDERRAAAGRAQHGSGAAGSTRSSAHVVGSSAWMRCWPARRAPVISCTFNV